MSNDGRPYTLHETTAPALARMRAHAENYEIEVQRVKITVFPGVWSPAYDWSGDFMVEHLPDVSGRKVLEVGSGSGVISLHAALAGASHVTAIDINPAAVLNTRVNFEQHGVSVGQALVSDVFSAVRDDFDLIIFNAPYHGSKPEDVLERAAADEGYASLRAFFAGVREHLRDGGQLYVGFSESGDLELFRQIVRDGGWVVRRELSEWRSGYNCMSFLLATDAVSS
jgi:methylase of polypeptide subunit release factors